MKTRTSKFRLFVVLSVVWLIIVLLSISGNARRYWDFSDYAIPFFIFTIPVWVFWSSVWVWPSRFNEFFDSKTNPTKSKSKGWVIVEEHIAKTHPYYGVGGWAILVIIGLVLSPLRMLFEFYSQSIDFNNVSHISGFMLLYRMEEIANWLVSGLCVLAAYYLISYKAAFQKLYLIIFIAGIFIPIIDTIAVVQVFRNSGININFNDIFTGKEMGRQFAMSIVGLFWLLYVFRSKRINITTRNRLRRKHMHLLKLNQDDA